MAFPNNASNGDTRFVDDIKYTYNDHIKMWEKDISLIPERLHMSAVTGTEKKGLIHNLGNEVVYRIVIYARRDASHWQMIDCDLNSHYDLMNLMVKSVETRGDYFPIKHLYVGPANNNYNMWCEWDSGSDNVDVWITVRVEGQSTSMRNTAKVGGVVPDDQIDWDNQYKMNTAWVGSEYDKDWKMPWGRVLRKVFAPLRAADNIYTPEQEVVWDTVPGRLYRVKLRLVENDLVNYDGGNGDIIARLTLADGSGASSWNTSFGIADTYNGQYWNLCYYEFDYKGAGIAAKSLIERHIHIKARVRDAGNRGIQDGVIFVEIEDLGLS